MTAASNLDAATTAAGDPYLTDYYNSAAHKLDDTYNIGQAQNSDAQQGADLSWAQKNQALDEKLQQEQNVMGDKASGRGILNSGIYNYGSTQYNPVTGQTQGMAGQPGGQMGIQQQTLADNATAETNSNQTLANTNQSYNDQGAQLTSTYNSSLADLTALATADATREATANSIAGIQA